MSLQFTGYLLSLFNEVALTLECLDVKPAWWCEVRMLQSLSFDVQAVSSAECQAGTLDSLVDPDLILIRVLSGKAIKEPAGENTAGWRCR